MLIGIAKPMPWLSPATAVLMPMTLPAASSSGPPLLPGLIAVSVWMRLDRWPPSTSMSRPSAEMMPLVTESENWPSGLPIAIACWPTWTVGRVADRRGGQARLVDLDDGEVGEGVDAVDLGVEGPAVLEGDRQLRGVAGDDVVVGEDEAVRVEDDAAAHRDALAGHAGRGVGRGDALGGDRDHGRADVLDDVDERAALAGRRRGLGRRGRLPVLAGLSGRGRLAGAGIHGDGRLGGLCRPRLAGVRGVVRAGRRDGRVGAARGDDSGADDGREQEGRPDAALGTRRGRCRGAVPGRGRSGRRRRPGVGRGERGRRGGGRREARRRRRRRRKGRRRGPRRREHRLRRVVGRAAGRRRGRGSGRGRGIRRFGHGSFRPGRASYKRTLVPGSWPQPAHGS